MKTGRRRKKEPRPESPQPAPSQPARPKPAPARPPAQAEKPVPARTLPRSALFLLPVLILLVLLICGVILLSRSCSGPEVTPATYLPATAEGSWTTTVNLMVPQVVVRDRFRSDYEADANCTVIAGTCEMRNREDDYTEQVVDDYDEYAYNIYYEEAEGRLYEAAGDSFVVTQLNEKKDWWEGDRHYLSEEWLDRETCQYTNYTVWITDPEDADYDIEVVLAECEVWDHVVVKERVYGEEEYCQTENVGSMEVQDTLTQRGVGTAVEWQEAALPMDGRLEREFEGTVIFRADGAERTVRTTDMDEYIRYLTVSYYLGLDESGKVVELTDRAP